MHPCPTCACHVRVADATCPHCGQAIGSRSNRVATAILALGLAGCTGGGGTKSTGDTAYTTSPQPAYGITVTDTGTDTGAHTGSTWTPQPAYGVTVTDTGADSAGDTGAID